jgi:hypothetical protein
MGKSGSERLGSEERTVLGRKAPSSLVVYGAFLSADE